MGRSPATTSQLAQEKTTRGHHRQQAQKAGEPAEEQRNPTTLAFVEYQEGSNDPLIVSLVISKGPFSWEKLK